MTDNLISKDFAEREVKDLIALIEKSDDLVPALLRFHLLTENLLERILLAQLPQGHRLLSNTSLSYRQKLEIVNAFDAGSPGLIGSLRTLNTIRNNASHERETTVTKDTIECIGRPLGKDFIKVRDEHSKDLKAFAFHTYGVIFAELIHAVYKTEHTPPLEIPSDSE